MMGLGTEDMSPLLTMPAGSAQGSRTDHQAVPVCLCLAGVSECSQPRVRAGDRAQRDFLLKNAIIDPGLYEFLQISFSSLSQPVDILQKIGISSSGTSKQKEIIKCTFI